MWCHVVFRKSKQRIKPFNKMKAMHNAFYVPKNTKYAWQLIDLKLRYTCCFLWQVGIVENEGEMISIGILI